MNFIEGDGSLESAARHTIGVRPEHLVGVRRKHGACGAATVGVSEHLGSDTFIHVRRSTNVGKP